MFAETTLGRRRMTETQLIQLLEAFTPMDAEEFCDRWHGIDKLPKSKQGSARRERGYRAKCVRLLATVLRKPEKTIGNWGSRFENMPEDYQATLLYADVVRQQISAAPDEILQLLVEQRNLKDKDDQIKN